MKTKLAGMVLSGLLLVACKPQTTEPLTQADTPDMQSQADDANFEQVSDRYLMDTKAVKTDCVGLLGPAVLKAIQPKDRIAKVVCGKMTLGLEATRQMIDIRHGSNQAAPWEDGPFTSGIFAIADNVLMTVYLFSREETLVLQAQ